MNIELIKNIVLVGLIVVVIAGLAIRGRKAEAKKAVLALVEEAETKFGPKTGDVKYKFVIDAVYVKLPSLARVFISRDDIDTWIDAGIKALEKKLKE